MTKGQEDISAFENGCLRYGMVTTGRDYKRMFAIGSKVVKYVQIPLRTKRSMQLVGAGYPVERIATDILST